MVHALLLALSLQAPDASPVRVWLGSGPNPAPGESVRVYVQTSTDGNLIVLHARPDGGVEILFPSSPSGDPFVRAGTYEIRGAGDGAAFVAAASQGAGTVLAALSPDQVWVDGFVGRETWDVTAQAGSDPEGVLTDLVQRMLGDGSFNYDLATYDIMPRADVVADAGLAPVPVNSCIDCSVTQIVILDDPGVRFVHPRHHSARDPSPPPTTSARAYTGPRPPEYTGSPSIAGAPRHRDSGDARAIPLQYRRRSSDAGMSDLARSRALVRPARAARPEAAAPAIASVAPRAPVPTRSTVALGSSRRSDAVSYSHQPFSRELRTTGPAPAAAPAPVPARAPAQPGTFAVSHRPMLPFYKGK